MRSIHHRGTDETPGLVLALDEAPGAVCHGVALSVAPESAAEVLEYLRERELISSAYIEKMLEIYLADGRRSFTLVESDTTPDAIYCVNNGVKLTIDGSDVTEPLTELANRGTDIASCGLCLEYFDAKDKLSVGRVSNMLELVNALEGAGNIIRL